MDILDSDSEDMSDFEAEPDGLSDLDLVTEDIADHGGVNSTSQAVILQQKAAEFLTYIKEICVTTETTITKVVCGVDDLMKYYNKFIQAKILDLGGDDDVVKKTDIQTLFSFLDNQSIFEGVQILFRREDYQKRRWNALVPRKIVLSWRSTILHGQVKEVPNHFGYSCFFLKQLECILQCEDVLNCVDNAKQSPPHLFRSALDGSFYQTHPVSQKHQSALGFILFVDDVVTIESLSSSSKGHSLRNYSWTLANIYPELRSTLRAINLLALAKASVAKISQNKAFLADFIAGINRLSSDEGVTLSVKGVPRVFHGFLMYVVGDYPASANIGGFKESAAFAWRPCRQCMITKDELSSKFSEEDLTLRSADMHTQHVNAVKSLSNKEEDNISVELPVEEEKEEGEELVSQEPENPSVLYGVNAESPLLQLTHFDVTKCLPQDTMHLFLEGIMKTACRLLLKHAIDKKLSLKEVNSFLCNHDYGKLKSDKPSPIELKHLKSGLHQTSSQVMMLSWLLPFILSNHCDKAVLLNFNLLLMIFAFCMSREVEVRDIDILREMIKRYVREFNDLFPGCIVSKHHFLIHLPMQIILFGPLTEQWAMRFEAFHSQLKRLTKVLHSAKNLAFSLINRVYSKQAFLIHQHGACFLRSSAVKTKLSEVEMTVSSLQFREIVLCCVRVSDNDKVVECEKLKWYGCTFDINDIIPIKKSEVDLPCFASIVKIYSFQEEKYVIVYRFLKTLRFCAEFNAYEILCSQVGCFGALDITNNFTLSTLMHIKYGGCDFVSFRQNSKPEHLKLSL